VSTPTNRRSRCCAIWNRPVRCDEEAVGTPCDIAGGGEPGSGAVCRPTTRVRLPTERRLETHGQLLGSRYLCRTLRWVTIAGT
jgi:hypothetical protein